MKGSQIVKMLSEDVIDRIVEMAWEDRTPFDAITAQFGLTESQIIALMRHQMKSEFMAQCGEHEFKVEVQNIEHVEDSK